MSAPTASTLPAGRELDALVSDAIFGPWDESRCRVCGWKIVPDGERGCWKDNCSMRWPGEQRPPRADEPPAYSTDIAAAWRIVWHFGGQVTIQGPRSVGFNEGEGYPQHWTVAFTDRAWDDIRGEADTAPHAICLAALQAVGGGALLPPEDIETKKVRGGGGSSGEPAQ